MNTRKILNVIDQINKIILGKNDKVKEIMTAFLANGHVMLEDIPGVGKTTLAIAFSKSLGLECNRIQFTPDVMPSDLVGFSIYRKDAEKFVYRPGSVFCNLLLADEINRTSPKTQSALLEVMEERKVSVEGITREVPKPFLVIATQNPYGSAGTQYLPDSQVDRFIISTSIGYPDFENEIQLAKSVGTCELTDSIDTILSKDELIKIQNEIHSVFINDEVYRYIVELITATRDNKYIDKGASPRATIALVKMSKAAAWLDRRSFVTPSDAANQFSYVVRHRIILTSAAVVENISKDEVIQEIIRAIKKPPLGDNSL